MTRSGEPQFWVQEAGLLELWSKGRERQQLWAQETGPQKFCAKGTRRQELLVHWAMFQQLGMTESRQQQLWEQEAGPQKLWLMMGLCPVDKGGGKV
jgi:hypothetical protein